jgi:hypothetical protein
VTNDRFGFRRGRSDSTAHPDRIGSRTNWPKPYPQARNIEKHGVQRKSICRIREK